MSAERRTTHKNDFKKPGNVSLQLENRTERVGAGENNWPEMLRGPKFMSTFAG